MIQQSPQQWNCLNCKALNAAHRDRCLRCKSARPSLIHSTIEAAKPVSEKSPVAWKEALDTSTRQIYYYNSETGESSWARPVELGAAPLASGWFGVGSVSSGASQAALCALNHRWLQRPARKQAELDPSKLQRAEGSNEYNVWWGKFIGDGWRGGMGRDPAPTFCVPERDAGWTKATLASLTERAYWCIHFARGGCAKGSECTYHHSIPTAKDDGFLDSSRDCFGRERHLNHRDDMGGVGSMLSNCRTLYVGGLKRPPPVGPQKTQQQANSAAAPCGAMAAWEEEVATHFAVWGELEHVNVIQRLAVAFVRYRCRANAEFALTAMANQSLGRGEVLNVRWAHDDPNPAAVAARARADEAAVEAALGARGLSLVDAPTILPPQQAQGPSCMPSPVNLLTAQVLVASGDSEQETSTAAAAAAAAGTTTNPTSDTGSKSSNNMEAGLENTTLVYVQAPPTPSIGGFYPDEGGGRVTASLPPRKRGRSE